MTLSPKCSTPSNTSLKESTIASACTRLLATCHRLNLKQRFCYETNLNYLCHFWGALQPLCLSSIFSVSLWFRLVRILTTGSLVCSFWKQITTELEKNK